MDSRNYFGVLLSSHYTTMTGWGVHLEHVTRCVSLLKHIQAMLCEWVAVRNATKFMPWP